jgi:hypothetical protein
MLSEFAAIYPHHPGALGSRQTRRHGPLYPRRHRHDRQHREPARPAVPDAQEAEKEQEGPAAGVTAAGHDPSTVGGRGYLPRPRTGVAARQCRARQPRPVEGDVSHRALPHAGARRSCGALREVRAHRHRLQQLPQSALPQVSRRGRQTMARRTRSRAAAGALLPRRVHIAGADRRHRLPEQSRDLRSVVQGRGRGHTHHRRRSQASGRQDQSDRCAPHLGLGDDPPSASA